MKTINRYIWILMITAVMTLVLSTAYAQRFGAMDPGSISGRLLISNGPDGPIHGGESAVTSMVSSSNRFIVHAPRSPDRA